MHVCQKSRTKQAQILMSNCAVCVLRFVFDFGFLGEGQIDSGKHEDFACVHLLCFSVTHPLAHFRTGRAGGFSYAMGDTAQSRMRA